MAFRSSADGIAKKGKTKGKCVSMGGNQIGGPTGGSFSPTPTTMPRSMPLPKGQ
jgi:hypothetical protein